MDKGIKNLLLYFMGLILLAMMSCTEDETTDLINSEIGTYETEEFSNLTVEEFEKLETPFDELLSVVSSGGRTKEDVNIDELTAALLEILDGAKKIEIKEGEERGLAVYEIELLLASGAKIEIVVVKDVFKILEIEGQSGPFDYDLDPQGNFKSLAETLLLAKDSLDGEITRWELELEEDNRWEFEVHIKTNAGYFEVEIDAFTGELLAINKIEEDDEKDFEEEDEQLPENVLEAVSWYIEGELIKASRFEEKERVYWNVYVKTESGALVKLIITEDTEDLVEVRDNDGPYDYNVTPGEGFISLNQAFETAQEAFEGTIYYWYFEEIWHQDQNQWAFVVKVKNEQNQYYKFGIDAKTGSILFEEYFD